VVNDETIRIHIPIPSVLVLRGDNLPLEIGRWDDNQREWTKNTVTNVNIDVDSMSITFDAPSTCGIYAIIQRKSTELRFSHWELSPSFQVRSSICGTQEDRTVVHYSICSKNFHLKFLIEEGYCSLVSPVFPQLKNDKTSKLLPKELMKTLRDCGINLCFSDSPSVLPNEKCIRVEERAYSDLSWLSSSFCIRSSTFNSDLGLYKACYLIKEADFFVDDDEEDGSVDEQTFHIALTERDSQSASALGASDPELKSLPSGCGTVKCSLLEYQDQQKEKGGAKNNNPLNTEAIANGTKAGIHMIQCIQPLCSAECIEREMNCSPILADTVKQLLQLTRPLSCC
jgi:hypothetical protein